MNTTLAFVTGQEYPCAGTTYHRFLQGAVPSNYRFSADGVTIEPFAAAGIATQHSRGLSLFVTPDGAPPHGVPRSSLLSDADPAEPRCFTLLRLDPEFALVFTHTFSLRSHRGRCQFSVAHFIAVPRVVGLTPDEFCARVQSANNWLPCTMRATGGAAEARRDDDDSTDDEPWAAGDLDGVLD